MFDCFDAVRVRCFVERGCTLGVLAVRRAVFFLHVLASTFLFRFIDVVGGVLRVALDDVGMDATYHSVYYNTDK